MKKYDYLVVGSGLYGAVFAHEARKAGKSVLVIDKRPNIAGNVYTEEIEKIHVHKYGAHIFHTNNKKVWNYITQFAEFNRFTNSPVANYKGKLYNLPFNMNTFYQMEPDRYVSHKLYRDVAGEHNEQAVKEALKNDGGYYRTEQMGNDDENAADLNRIWDAGQNITSIYSSAYNSEYQTFRQKNI